MHRNKLTWTLVATIVLFGVVLRFSGIRDNHSFWSDEAYVAGIARDILQHRISPIAGLTLPGASYQPLHIVSILISFSMFGFNEFAARLPSVLFSSVGIVIAFLLGRKLSNTAGGIIACFLWSFAQINLAMATQAKPYSYIQTAFIAVIYLLTQINDSRRERKIHLAITLIASSATLMHLIGITVFIPYLFYLVQKYIPFAKENKRRLLYLVPILIVSCIVFLEIARIIALRLTLQEALAHFNNFTYFRELLWRNYAFIVLPATFGLLAGFRKYPVVTSSLTLWIAVLCYFWIFRGYSHNVRYLIPLFGLLFIYFGVFWGIVAEKVLHQKYLVTVVIITGMLYVGGYKVIRKPASYYSPNADLLGDVQIADYKNLYTQVRQRIPGLSRRAIFNDWYDTQHWYLDYPVTAYFMKGKTVPEKHNVDGQMIYGTLAQFKHEMKKYPQGIVVVEDWESIMPEDIKQYVKKNLKREIRVDGLPQAQRDNWGLEVYSWNP